MHFISTSTPDSFINENGERCDLNSPLIINLKKSVTKC